MEVGQILGIRRGGVMKTLLWVLEPLSYVLGFLSILKLLVEIGDVDLVNLPAAIVGTYTTFVDAVVRYAIEVPFNVSLSMAVKHSFVVWMFLAGSLVRTNTMTEAYLRRQYPEHYERWDEIQSTGTGLPDDGDPIWDAVDPHLRGRARDIGDNIDRQRRIERFNRQTVFLIPFIMPVFLLIYLYELMFLRKFKHLTFWFFPLVIGTNLIAAAGFLWWNEAEISRLAIG